MYILTNIGLVPVDDYKEMIALQNGFDSYEDLVICGYDVDISSEFLVDDDFIESFVETFKKAKKMLDNIIQE